MDTDRRPQTATQQQHQPLPSIAQLTSSMPQSDPSHSPLHGRQQSDARDSGNWSLSQGMSKHSSTISTSTGQSLQLHTILNAEDSPSRNSQPETPSSGRYPASQLNALPSLNHGFENRNSTVSTDASSHLDSRRSSVDSRMNSGMGHLQIGPSSPYENQSQNTSRVSLVSNLQQQRGVPTDQRPNGSSPLSPLGPRANGVRTANSRPRQAPIIQPDPRNVSGMPNPTAQAPTKGYAWAFPDVPEVDERRTSSSDSSERRSISRQNSFAASMNSSVFTHDGPLPPGQKRFGDDDLSTHHHSMAHRSVTTLQNNDHAAPAGSGNYSRTPELRVSHKMAERKRRSEMKGLFDELNNILPNSPGSKSSKWEILTKSIDHIRNLQKESQAIKSDYSRMQPEAQYARRCQEENDQLRAELAAMSQHLRRLDPSNTHVYGPVTGGMYAQQQNQMPQQTQLPGHAGNTLPPLQGPPQPQPPSQWAAPGGVMQGIEFASGHTYERR